jgi:hypothetical protein
MSRFALICLILAIIGCNSLPDLIPLPVNDPETTQKETLKDLKEVDNTADKVKNNQKDIKQAVDNAVSKDPKPEVREDLQTIDNLADDSIDKVEEIKRLTALNEERTKTLNQVIKSDKALREQNIELREKLRTSRDKYFIIAYGVCGLIIALSVALAWFGNPKAIAGAIFGVICIVITIMIEQLLEWAPYIGIIGGAALVLMIVLEARKAKNTQNTLDHVVTRLPEGEKPIPVVVKPRKQDKIERIQENILQGSIQRINKKSSK